MIWDKSKIAAALKKLHKQGNDLSYNLLAKKDQSLVSAAAYHFGSYRKAVERAGIDYAEVIRRPRWTKTPLSFPPTRGSASRIGAGTPAITSAGRSRERTIKGVWRRSIPF